MENQEEVVEVVKAEKNNRFKPGTGAVFLLTLIVVIGLVSQLKKTAKVVDSTPAPQVAAEITSAPESVEVTRVTAGAFYYLPNMLTVKKGELVKLELAAMDMMHDFNIDELGVKSPVVKSGEAVIVEFVAEKSGEFEYYCSVGQHRKNGQVGKLIVEE